MSLPAEDELSTAEPGIRPLAVVNMLLRRRWSIVAITGSAVAVAVAMALLSGETWTCSIRFLPSGGAGVAGRMGALVGPSGVPDEDATPVSGDYYADLLRSTAFAESIVKEPFEIDGSQVLLADHWDVPGDTERERTQRAAEALAKGLRVTVAKASGAAAGPRLVTVEVSADRRALSAEIAARILDRINLHNETVRGLRSRRNLAFISARLDDARRDLKAATDRFAEFSARNRKIATPALVAERDRLEREVRVKEEVFLTLTKQAELAKIEEQDQRILIEVIQPPEPPLQRSAPRRTQVVAVGGFLGLVLAIGWVVVTEWYRRLVASDDPEVHEFRSLSGSLIRPWAARRQA